MKQKQIKKHVRHLKAGSPVHFPFFEIGALKEAIDAVVSSSNKQELRALYRSWTPTQRLQVAARLQRTGKSLWVIKLLSVVRGLSDELVLLKLQALIDLKQFREAEHQASCLLASEPNNAQVRWIRYNCRKSLGRYVDALDDRIFLVDESDEEELYWLQVFRARLNLEGKRFSDAENDIRKAEKQGQSSADLYHIKGEIALHFGDYVEAVRYFSQALKAVSQKQGKKGFFSPKDHLFQRAYSLQKMGKNRQALADLDQALIAEAPSRSKLNVLCARARLLKQMGEKGQALADVSFGLKLSPNNIHLRMLWDELVGGRSPAYIQVSDSGSQKEMFHRVLYLYLRGQYREALKQINTSVLIHGDNTLHQYWRAQLYGKLGQEQNALRITEVLEKEALGRGKIMLWASIKDPEWKERLSQIFFS